MDTCGAGLISINVGRPRRGRGGTLGVCMCVWCVCGGEEEGVNIADCLIGRGVGKVVKLQ